MAELTALSVACPAAAPYLRHRSDQTIDKDGEGKTEHLEGSINKDYKEVMRCVTNITPMHVLSLKSSNFWQLEGKIPCDILIPVQQSVSIQTIIEQISC